MREDSTKLPATSRMAGFFPLAHQPRVRLAGEAFRKWQRAWNLGQVRESRMRAGEQDHIQHCCGSTLPVAQKDRAGEVGQELEARRQMRAEITKEAPAITRVRWFGSGTS